MAQQQQAPESDAQAVANKVTAFVYLLIGAGIGYGLKTWIDHDERKARRRLRR